MNIKRNIISILYAALYILVMGVALFEILNLTFITSSSKYLVAGIVVLGIIIYLIIAFLVKENGIISQFEQKKVLLFCLEIFVIMACVGALFLVRASQNITIAVLHSLLLLCFAIVGRFLFGRLNGIITVFIGFTFLFFLETVVPLDASSTVSVLCFLIPYAVFLGVSRYIVSSMAQNPSLIVMSYLILGFVFSVAIGINSLVVLLFFGCILSLLFGRHKDDKHCLVASGIPCAGLLLLFTILIITVAYFIIPELITVPDFQIDPAIILNNFDYWIIPLCINKFTRIIQYLLLSFGSGIIPTILLFFAVLSGYYCIVKKVSYIGPVLFSFLGLIAYYILFCKTGSPFPYFTYFLPILISYGFTNTLIPYETNKVENKSVDAHGKTDEIQEETPAPDEENDGTEEESVVPPVEPAPVKKQKENDLASVAQNILSSVKDEDEIPEWTISEDYVAPSIDNPVVEKTMEQPKPDFSSVESEEESEVTSEEESESAPGEQLSQQDDMGNEDNMLSMNSISRDMEEEPSLVESFAEHTENTTDVTNISNDGSNDMEQFIAQDNVLELDELLERLDISDNIKRMNERAQEDMADVIERDEEKVELDDALPLKPSKSTLPKYKKPNFDFEMEPVSIPLDDSYSNISEYDEVPTVHDLESKWKSQESTIVETVASPVNDTVDESNNKNYSDVHSDEIVRKNGSGKRSYHRITIR